MSIFTTAQHNTLKQAIQTLEKGVVGELVVVVAKSSDNYRFIPTLWAALAALALPGLYLLGQWLFSGGWSDELTEESKMSQVYFAQVALFFGLLLLFHWSPVQRVIVPSYVQRQRASRFAQEQFLVQQLHHTTDRCGAIVFISLLEHHVEIMVDKGLSDHVDNTYWQGVISRMSPLLQRGDVAGACEVAIDAVSETMHIHCPRDSNSPKDNELPDHVIEL